MSTTVSIGVWSVMVMGAISNIFLSLSGGGEIGCKTGVVDTNNTKESPLKPSTVRFAFSGKK